MTVSCESSRDDDDDDAVDYADDLLTETWTSDTLAIAGAICPWKGLENGGCAAAATFENGGIGGVRRTAKGELEREKGGTEETKGTCWGMPNLVSNISRC